MWCISSKEKREPRDMSAVWYTILNAIVDQLQKKFLKELFSSEWPALRHPPLFCGFPKGLAIDIFGSIHLKTHYILYLILSSLTCWALNAEKNPFKPLKKFVNGLLIRMTAFSTSLSKKCGSMICSLKRFHLKLIWKKKDSNNIF